MEPQLRIEASHGWRVVREQRNDLEIAAGNRRLGKLPVERRALLAIVTGAVQGQYECAAVPAPVDPGNRGQALTDSDVAGGGGPANVVRQRSVTGH